MNSVRSIAARGIVPCLLLLTLALSSCVSSPEAKSARFIEAGKKLMKNKDATRAILQFENAVKATPQNAEAYYQLGAAYLAAGDLRKGIVALHKALELNPKHWEAQLRLAQLMSGATEKQFLQDAQQRLESMVQDNPTSSDALQALALTELKLGDQQDAVQHLERALAVAPQELRIAVALAQAKLQQKDTKSAEQILKHASESAPQSAQAAGILGEFYVSQNRAAEAEPQYLRALEIDPSYAPVLFDLVMLQAGTGRKAEAERNLKRLAGLSDKRFEHFYAVFLFRENRRDEALREFQRLAKEDPEDRSARTRLIVVYRALNREADADRVLEGALRKNPKDLDALLQRAEISLAAKKYAQAESDLNRVIALSPTSAEPRYIMAKLEEARGEALRYRASLFKALELDRYMLDARLELAQSLIVGKDGKAALALLNAAPESQKDGAAYIVKRNWALWTSGDLAEMRKGIDHGLSRGRTADLLLQDGLWKLSTGNNSGARAALEDALKIDPRDVGALKMLNAAYLAQKQDKMALQKVKDYASREPKSAPVQEFLGTVLVGNGERQEARAAFEAAIAADPKSVSASLLLIQLDMLDGKFDSARQRLTTILASDGTNLLARRWLANLETTKGDYKAAIEQFRQVAAADPGNAECLNNLAYLLAETGGQPTEALKYAQKAKELAPDNPAYADTLGWILYRMGLYPSAVSELERATSKGGTAIPKYHLAMAYAKAGDLNRGRAALQAGLRQNPRAPEAKAARELLEAAQR
jgi:tetratricopeptide (TPR) repeat protein